MKRFFLLSVFLFSQIYFFAQTQRALDLRKNVVAISAMGEQGFGFITGSRYDKLFVVTAAHVVEFAVEEKEPVMVQFYNDYRNYSGYVIRNFPEVDIALMEVDMPERFSWEQKCIGEVKEGLDVAFVGREKDWYVPPVRSLGTIYKIQNDLIEADIPSVMVGTSGAPLITNSGIVGMIVQTDGIKAIAVHLDQLKKIVSEYDYFYTLTGKITPQTSKTSTENNSNTAALLSIEDRDGNRYPTKIMKDGLRWITTNLNIQLDQSWCYYEPSNCNKYGRLYTLESAKEGCKLLGSNWRLPTDKEWRKLLKNYGGSNADSKDGGRAAFLALFGEKEGIFSKQMGGRREIDGKFYMGGQQGYFWTSTLERNGPYVWTYGIDEIGKTIGRSSIYFGAYGLSVRCVQSQ
jgi:uncharacterized protein (TIGR02145 family)